jgi:putative spermidine/putrescine transport system substrate-binding protein
MATYSKKIMMLLGASAMIATSATAADLTVVSWGGAYTKSQVEAYHKPWMAKTGKSIVSEDYGGGIAEIKAQVEAGNVTWDVVDVELSDAIRACDEGLLETIDHSILCMNVRLPISCGRLFMLMTHPKCRMVQKPWPTSLI